MKTFMFNLFFVFCFLQGALSQKAVFKVNSLAELDYSATAIQFKNRATGMFVVLKPDPRGGGALEGNVNPDGTPWHFYQAAGAARNNVEIKRSGFAGFNWSDYPVRSKESAFIAWNHAKRFPNTTSPKPPHAWFLEDAGNGFFRIKLSNGKCMQLMPGMHLYIRGSKGPKIITMPFDKNEQHQQWEIYTNKPKSFAPDVTSANPHGVWDFGYGIVGGDFNRFTRKVEKGTVLSWQGKNSWQGVYQNKGNANVNMSQGLVFKPGELVMHPANTPDHLAKIRFISPADGKYKIDVKWTAIDHQAKKIWTWVYTNAASLHGNASSFKEVHTKGMQGYNSSIVVNKTIVLKKGEIVSFEVGNSGDSFSDDSAQTELKITRL